jgi:hypothetical protein
VSTFDEQADHARRLEFLYKAVEDTQATIRFIDTKAAFCVTLLSGMVAGALQGTGHHHLSIHDGVFDLFLAATGLCLLVCLRVIFPVIKPQKAPHHKPARALPKFYIHQQKGHHWLRHTFSNSVDDVLADDHASYTATLALTNDADLTNAMCDELLMVSLIRQIKSDRLHAAMFLLVPAVALFLAFMVT